VTRFLSVAEVVELHRLVLGQSGGLPGVRDPGGLESAAAQPRATFGAVDLYPGLAAKAAALGFSLAGNHPFLDGNKRVGHAAAETFLVLNGWELAATTDEQERVILRLAAGRLGRDEFATWVQGRMVEVVARTM